MPVAPNTDNYTLGKGVVYFNQKDQSSGLYKGERDLGNAPSFSFNIALDKLEHFSSRGGLKAKDKEIISQITPGVSFTLDEVNKDNYALLTLADVVTVNQTAGSVSAEAIVAHINKRAILDNRKVGSYKSTISNLSGSFQAKETITGGTSGATATLINSTSAEVAMVNITGTFQAGEQITGGTSAATADIDTVPAFNPGVILLEDDTQTTIYTAGTDYSLNETLKDPTIGRIFFPEGTSITEGSTVRATYDYDAYTYSEIRAFKNTQVEGVLRYVSDNPAGTQQELIAWRCSLTPSGDTSLIGDDWSTLGFSGEILKDEVNHPDSPYMTIIME